MIRLILASRSPHRLQLLRDAGYEASVVVPEAVEPSLDSFDDLEVGLAHVAQSKARDAWRQGACGLIVAADTVGRAAGAIFGKPIDRADAHRMLLAISGTTHEVLTGWCLLRTKDGLLLSGVERTIIHMRRWSHNEREAYLDRGDWKGKSGAYGLELPNDPFVTQIEGSATNVVGLPLERLHALLAEFPTLTCQPRDDAPN